MSLFGQRTQKASSSPPFVVTTAVPGKLAAKALYFMRNLPPSATASIRLDVDCDDTLLTGEVGDHGTLLQSLTFLVSNVFHNRLMQQKDWGLAPTTAVQEFVAEAGTFASSVEESMRGMGGGGAVVLAKVDAALDLDSVGHASASGNVDAEVAKHFEGGVSSHSRRQRWPWYLRPPAAALRVCVCLLLFSPVCVFVWWWWLWASGAAAGQVYWSPGAPASLGVCRSRSTVSRPPRPLARCPPCHRFETVRAVCYGLCVTCQTSFPRVTVSGHRSAVGDVEFGIFFCLV